MHVNQSLCCHTGMSQAAVSKNAFTQCTAYSAFECCVHVQISLCWWVAKPCAGVEGLNTPTYFQGCLWDLRYAKSVRKLWVPAICTRSWGASTLPNSWITSCRKGNQNLLNIVRILLLPGLLIVQCYYSTLQPGGIICNITANLLFILWFYRKPECCHHPTKMHMYHCEIFRKLCGLNPSLLQWGPIPHCLGFACGSGSKIDETLLDTFALYSQLVISVHIALLLSLTDVNLDRLLLSFGHPSRICR